MKGAIKERLALAFERGGVFAILRRLNRAEAFVLTYHRVLNDRRKEALFVQPGMYVSVENFRRQLLALKERFDIVPLGELVDRIGAGKSVGGCCAITFDDGWRDNFTCAFPVLDELQVPATVFLATGFVGTRRLFWPEELSFYLSRLAVRESAKSSAAVSRFLEEVGDGGGDEGAFLDRAIAVMKGRPVPERENILAHVRSVSSVHPTGRALMSWEEAARMQAGGLIRFESHTSRHEMLDKLPLPQAEEEIVRSRLEMERHLGVRPRLFAYPNGNVSRGVQALLHKNGFKGAVTTRRGWIGPRVPLFEIPRIGVHEDVSRSEPLFWGRILLKRF